MTNRRLPNAEREELALDGGFAVRSEGDDADRDAEIILHELDIVLEGLRQIGFLADAGEVGIPAFEVGIDRFDFGRRVEGELLGFLAADAV